MTIQNYPGSVVAQPWISGLVVSNDTTSPNTVLDISAGICRDSNNIVDLTVGINNTNFEGQFVSAPLFLNAATTGLNGLDTGALVASTVYAVYIIGDSTYQHPTGALLSLASNAVPLMPAGYDSLRLICYWSTDSSAHFVLAYQLGNGSQRTLRYVTPIQVLAGGAATSLTGVNLSTLLPLVNNLIVYYLSLYSANAAGNNLNLTDGASAGGTYTYPAAVAGGIAATSANTFLLAQVVSGVIQVKYSVSAGTVNSFLQSFTFYV